MYKLVNKARDRARDLAVITVAALPALAFAQGEGGGADPFAGAVTEITAKIGEWGPQLVTLSVVGLVFFVAIKFVKRIRGAV